jgi:hypothetical protein
MSHLLSIFRLPDAARAYSTALAYTLQSVQGSLRPATLTTLSGIWSKSERGHTGVGAFLPLRTRLDQQTPHPREWHCTQSGLHG